jgi:phosphate transport system substrate-binding protein
MLRQYYWNCIMVGLSLVLLSITGCSSAVAEAGPEEIIEPTEQVILKVSGSGSAEAVLNAIQPAFAADTPGYDLEVIQGTGTGGGVQSIVHGVLDVAAMARPPKDEEAAQNVEYVEFGQACQAVITHPDVGVTNLTTAQVVGVFSGKITDWSEVGGPELPMVLYVRDEADSSTKALRAAIMGDTPFAETVVKVITSQDEMQVVVAGIPGSIGIGTWPTALANGADVQALTIDGIASNDSNCPMIGPLGIGYLTERHAEVQPLIDWLLSESGRAALHEVAVITSGQ